MSRAAIKIVSGLLITLALASDILIFAPRVSAQMRTVGDGTVFMYNPGKSESYGISTGDIGSFSSETFSSRHNRLGVSTGIGSSFLQTTSPTSESRPAVPSTFSSFSGSGYGDYPLRTNSGSPALADYVGGPQNSILGRAPFSTSTSSFSSGTSPALSPMSTSEYTRFSLDSGYDLNALPSFSRRPHTALPMSTTGSEQIFKKIVPDF